MKKKKQLTENGVHGRSSQNVLQIYQMTQIVNKTV